MKVKASTLIETIVAMILLLLCFGIFLMVYNNILGSNYNALKLKANLLINELASKSKQENKYIDQEMNFENITVVKRITKYGELGKLDLLELTAYDNNHHELASRKELIIIE